MGIVQRLRAEKRATTFNPLHPRDPALAQLWGFGATSVSGQNVTPESAMQLSAVLAAVRYLSETVASLPLQVYRRGNDNVREIARDHAWYEPLHDAPNRYQTSFEWRDMAMQHLLLRGNAYSRIVFNSPAGRLPRRELLPLHPDRVTPYWSDGNIAYAYDPPVGERETLLADEMLHIRFMPGDGLSGVSVLKHARETIGHKLALAEYGGLFFANSARPSGVLQHPRQLSKEAQNRLLDDWNERFRGSSSSSRGTAVLEEGMTWTPVVGIAPEDAQYIQAEGMGVADIARIFRVQPHKIGDLSRSTFSNIEHQSIEAVQDSLRPWLVRWEQAIRRGLFAGDGGHFVEFNLDALLRGDTVTRYQAAALARQNGWLSANEIRASDNLPPIQGGDVYMMTPNATTQVLPSGMPTPDGAARNWGAPEQRALPASRDDFLRLRRAWTKQLEDAATRLLKRDAAEVARHFKTMARSTRTVDDFDRWLTEFGADASGSVARAMAPTFESYLLASAELAASMAGSTAAVDLGEFPAAYTAAYAARHSARSVSEIRALLEAAAADELAADMDELMENWRTVRPGEVAAHESVKASSAAARVAWMMLGVENLRWVASPQACPICEEMDGQVVGIGLNFVNAGDEAPSADADAPGMVAGDTAHPPLHTGCTCQVLSD